jgi:integrase
MPKVSLQVAHRGGSRQCRSGQQTSLKSLKACNCEPVFYTYYRASDGRPVKGKVRFRDLKEAEREQTALQASLNSGLTAFTPVRSMTFSEWADQWLAGHRGKASTKRQYEHPLAIARETFGHAQLRGIGSADVQRFLQNSEDAALIRQKKRKEPKPLSQATLAAHLRVLHACFEAAVPEFLDRNPVELLHRSHRPKAAPARWDYFEDSELEKLWPAMKALEHEAVYVALFKTLTLTGLRLGEALALQRGDVDLQGKTLHVRRAYRALRRTDGTRQGATTPKSGKGRTVDLLPQVVTVLKAWLEVAPMRGREGLIFGNDNGGFLDATTVTTRRLRPAMEKAGVPRTGPNGHLRTTHSLRSTFARIALESGAPMTWVASQLGHSSTAITEKSYAGFSSKAARLVADQIKAGFAI